MEPATGLEPVTSPLPRKCSTAELRGLIPEAIIQFCQIFGINFISYYKSLKKKQKKTTEI
jgi:hypothetical protein